MCRRENYHIYITCKSQNSKNHKMHNFMPDIYIYNIYLINKKQLIKLFIYCNYYYRIYV